MASMLSWRNEAGGVTNVVIGFVLLMMKSEMFIVGLRLVLIMIMMMLCWWCCVVLILIIMNAGCLSFLFYEIVYQLLWKSDNAMFNVMSFSRLCQKQYLRSSLFHLSRSYHQSCNWPIDSWIVTLILIQKWVAWHTTIQTTVYFRRGKNFNFLLFNFLYYCTVFNFFCRQYLRI